MVRINGAVLPVALREGGQDSSVGITTVWTARVRFYAEARNFPIIYSVQTRSGVFPVSYRIGTEGSFPGLKLPGREADQADSPTGRNITAYK
jgi:hypothetical protein